MAQKYLILFFLTRFNYGSSKCYCFAVAFFVSSNLNTVFFSEWYGVLFVHSNLYQGGVFRFTLTIPANFPEGMPVSFLNVIFYIFYKINATSNLCAS